jgi:D-serine deaminase-like pyridoxal phosphate-dependent protein
MKGDDTIAIADARGVLEDIRVRAMAMYRRDIGRSVDELVTPVLVLDVDAAERNIDHMAARLRTLSAGIRPHVKVHKSPELARL